MIKILHFLCIILTVDDIIIHVNHERYEQRREVAWTFFRPEESRQEKNHYGHNFSGKIRENQSLKILNRKKLYIV